MDPPILAEGFFTSLLNGLDPDHKFVLFLVFFGCVTGIAIAISVSVAKAWESVRRRETEVELIRDLLDQGKSPEEIGQILQSPTPSSRCSRETAAWVKPGPSGA